ncbi:MAG: hypothetical protein K5694_07335 [Bacilli bacterium]|nr:hypothetical protein [Bacilli bacterium]
MEEVTKQEETPKKLSAGKIVSYVIDGILVLFILFVISVQIQMVASRNSNFGVPRAYGLSFMYVATDSMQGDQPDSFNKGTGIVIKQVNQSEIKLGDVVTFYDERIKAPNTHRIFEEPTIDENNVYHFHTMGDNAKSESGSYSSLGEFWTGDKLIGKVIAHNDAFGAILSVISPTASGMKSAVDGKGANTSWVFPVILLIPIAGITVVTIIDFLKKAKKQRLAEEAEIHAAMLEAGVDPNNEEDATYFEQKYRFKIEFREQLAKEKAKKKKQFEKELRKKKG